ncbi:EAL domain-containing protein [Thalassomonas sp. RHCl1]|uniref:putative bifunctional diguanylate cyclase/phosphodiesterase n=1 Tax=Thalassomonas sp. RHCl1 TaxID=2995320 RepID=UPI00248CE0E5|nr:EAL domain-containing protein [Thalassomonas sp. RHCl1]
MIKQSVLVVDDKKENLHAISRVLASLDVNIVTADSGEEALRRVIKQAYALVLLDVLMPGMGGFEVAELMRSNKNTRNIPIIFVTAMSRDAQNVFRGYEAGAVDYLLKPIEAGVLLSKVKVLLDLDRQKQELAQSLAQKQASEKIIQVLMNAQTDSALLLDNTGKVLALNEVMASRLNRPLASVVGNCLFSLLPEQQAEGLQEQMSQVQESHQLQHYEENVGDLLFQVTLLPVVEFSSEKIQTFALFARDITQERQVALRLEQLANYDQLTGLSNRATYYTFQDKLIAGARREQHSFAVLFIDLDRFKQINDTLGHDAGDHVLSTVASRITAGVRKSDIVARLGGDEFAIATDKIADQQHAANIAAKLIACVIAPIDYLGGEVFVGCSIGIACFPDNGSDKEALNRAADIAMYAAKRQGGNSYCFFDPELQQRNNERTRLVNGLRHALEKEQMRVYYQPKFSALTGEMVGVEALMRWCFDDSGMIAPSVFIPLAEECGLIIEFGSWVFNRACMEIKALNDEELALGVLSVSVNVSPKQLKVEGFDKLISKVLEQCEIPPAHVQIELTESLIMEDPEASIEMLSIIRSYGISIAVDDFGTGYSSLSYLRRLPIDTLKIDISFVREIGKDSESEAIIKGIIALAHSLGLETVAEGVETKEQVAFLQQHGCSLLQGYYFSKPVDIEALYQFSRDYIPMNSKSESRE